MLSLYNTKPFYYFTTCAENLKQEKVTQKVWNAKEKRKIECYYLKLNVINDYNDDMDHVDISDHLQGSYRFTHWLRNFKWNWSIFFWGMEQAMINSYVLYRKYMILHNYKERIVSHHDFQEQIALAQLFPKKHWPKYIQRKKVEILNDIIEKPQTVRNNAITDKSLASSGYLNMRLNVNCNHLPTPCIKKESICQLHRWALGRKYKSKILHCKTCSVSLCDFCYEPFHKIENLVNKKDELKSILLEKSSTCSIISELINK